MDFGLLPPEVNSGRMYAGSGPGPMLAAATAWDGLAAELHNMAATYDSSVSDLVAGWHGPSAETMAASAAPYAAWLHTTATQAELTAAQARAAAAAYEAAFAATVPPPLIEANRSLLITLVATNILGQNTPAIAATEAHYAEMWAQDATAMYGYAAAATTASRLAPFSEPPPTANPAAAQTQAAAVAQAAGAATGANIQSQLTQLTTLVPNALQGLTAGAAAASGPSSIESVLSQVATFLSTITGPYSPIGWIGIPGGWWLTAMQVLGTAQNVPGVLSLLGGPAPITGALGPLSGGYVSFEKPVPGTPAVGRGLVLASAGRAASLGALSVPTSWASAVPAVKTLAATLPSAGPAAAAALGSAGQNGLLSSMAMSSLAGRAIAGGATQSVVGTTARVIDRKSTVVGDDDPSSVTILVIQPTQE